MDIWRQSTKNTSSPIQDEEFPPEIDQRFKNENGLIGYKDKSPSSSDDEYSDNEGCGYRLIDLTTFSSSISDLHKCDEGEIL